MLVFFDRDWVCLFYRDRRASMLSGITGIPDIFLGHRYQNVVVGPRSSWLRTELQSVSVADRMSWAAERQTTRIEDQAYCLMGIFDVNMPLVYGEGDRAFRRLQEEIVKVNDDKALLIFDGLGSRPQDRDLFAHHALEFCGEYRPDRSLVPETEHCIMSHTALGLELNVLLCSGVVVGKRGPARWLALLHCSHKRDSPTRPGIMLEPSDIGQRRFWRPQRLSSPLVFQPERGMEAEFIEALPESTAFPWTFRITSTIEPARITLLQPRAFVDPLSLRPATKFELILPSYFASEGYQIIAMDNIMENESPHLDDDQLDVVQEWTRFRGPFFVCARKARKLDVFKIHLATGDVPVCGIERVFRSVSQESIRWKGQWGHSEAESVSRILKEEDTWMHRKSESEIENQIGITVSISKQDFLGKRDYKTVIKLENEPVSEGEGAKEGTQRDDSSGHEDGSGKTDHRRLLPSQIPSAESKTTS